MNLIRFTIQAIALIFIFTWVWNLAAIVPSIVLAWLPKRIRILLFQSLGAFFGNSLIVLLAYFSVQKNGGSLWPYFIVGLFLVYFGWGQGIYDKLKQSEMRSITLEEGDADTFLLMIPIAIVLYVIIFLFPFLSGNVITVFILKAIQFLMGIPILGWIIGLGAIIIFLGYIWNGIMLLGILASSISERFRRKEVTTQ